MAFYEDMQDVVVELLRPVSEGGFGIGITLTDTIPGEYNPVTGDASGDVPITQNAIGLKRDFSLQESGQQYADGTQIRQGDKLIMIAAKGLEWVPSETTKVNFGGVIWTIKNIKENEPTDVPLIYLFGARK